MFTPEMASRIPSIEHAGLVDLDVTVLGSLVIFLFLLAVLNSMLFQPYLKILTERDKRIEGERDRAATMSARAEASFEEYQQRLADARSEASKVREALRREGQAEEQTIVTAAKEIATTTVTEGQAHITEQMAEAVLAVDAKATELSKVIASHVLSRA